MPNNNETIPIVSSLKGKEYSNNSLDGIVNALKGASTMNVEHAMGL